MVRIDYLTCTCSDALEYDYCRRAIQTMDEDDEPREQEFYGFRGLRWEFPDGRGTRFVGTREADGYAMISASGAVAHTEALRLRFLSCWRPSRVDICVDVQKQFDVPSAYARWQGKSKVKMTAIEDETLYIGSRKSELFWRVYNKAAELGRPEIAPLWRVELELKGQRAKQFWGLWQQHDADLPGIMRAYLWQADGQPRQPAHALLEEFLYAETHWHIGSLPRRRRAGEEYLMRNVIPFLRDNWEWAGPIIMNEIGKEGAD